MKKADMALIGLAVMGQNLVLNMERNGFSVAVYNRTFSKTEEFVKNRGEGKNIIPAGSFGELCSFMKSPRIIFLMVRAGKPVDDAIDGLLPFLGEGDIILDGGNSHSTDTERRRKALSEKGIRFLGVGISGGEEGALNGPSIMAGGDESAFRHVEHILMKISAKAGEQACCAYLGKEGAGHFVKMVHNGIEYGIMQAIADCFNFLKRGMGLSLSEISDVFAGWNRGICGSYLVEITGHILRAVDRETGLPLLEMILDRAEQKGTGKWTSQASLEFGEPLNTIDTAVFTRCISVLKEERILASSAYERSMGQLNMWGQQSANVVENALFCTMVAVYAQGMNLLDKVGEERGFGWKMPEIARIWKGGCIIRAGLLEDIERAYTEFPGLPCILLDDYFITALSNRINDWRVFVSEAVMSGLPCPAISSALEYFDCYTTAGLPTNLIQAQRDYFGSHGYERIDRPGKFHGGWD